MASAPKQVADNEWDLVIKPRQHLLDIDFSEVWRYRDLLMLFVRRDFVAMYKQTILGPVWHLIQPVLTTVMFLLVFGRIARIPTDGIPPIAFYMSGITLWNYFSISLTSTSNSFVANAPIFGKVYFPRIIVPLSLIISNIIRLGIQFLLLSAVILWYHFDGHTFVFTLNILWIPLLILVMAGIALGCGIIVSSLTTKYRDFTVLLGFAVQLLMYATPIAYPMSYLRDTKYAWMIGANPLTPLVEAFRYALFSKGTFTTFDICYSIAFMATVLMIGFAMFTKVEKSFMDTV